MSVSKEDPMWKTLEGVLYTLDKVSYMAVPVKPVFKPEPKEEREKSPVLPRNTGICRGKLRLQLEESKYGIAWMDETQKSPVLPRNTGMSRGKLKRQLEETKYGIAWTDETLRRELRQAFKCDYWNENCRQPWEERFKCLETDNFTELPPVRIPENEEYIKFDYYPQFANAETPPPPMESEFTPEGSSFALYQPNSQIEKLRHNQRNNAQQMNPLFRNRMNLKCRNALILNLKKRII